MRRVSIRRIALALALALAAHAAATSVLERTLAEIFARADAIVYGEVTSVDTELVDDQLRTLVEIDVERVFSRPGEEASDGPGAQGGTENDVRTLAFLAGRTPSGRTTVVDDVPLPSRGDRVLVASYSDDGLVSPVVGVWQGLWRLTEDGLVDLRGRVLGVDDDLITLGGVERDVARVLNALEVALGDAGDVLLDDRAVDSDPAALQNIEPDTAPDTDVDSEVAADPENEPSESEEDLAAEATDAPSSDGPAAPIELRLDVPDDDVLRSALDDAVRSWTDVGVPLRLVIDAETSDRVRIGSLAAFGPDALAYSRRVADRDGVELLLRPGEEGRRVDVLARELGRWVGLPADGPLEGDRPNVDDGLRSGLFPSGELLRADAEDAAALLRSRSALPEDLDGDGVVDLYDLALLAEAYGSVGTRLPADLDGSGRVDDGDLARLEEAYEFLPPSRDAPSERRSTQQDSAQPGSAQPESTQR